MSRSVTKHLVFYFDKPSEKEKKVVSTPNTEATEKKSTTTTKKSSTGSNSKTSSKSSTSVSKKSSSSKTTVSKSVAGKSAAGKSAVSKSKASIEAKKSTPSIAEHKPDVVISPKKKEDLTYDYSNKAWQETKRKINEYKAKMQNLQTKKFSELDRNGYSIDYRMLHEEIEKTRKECEFNETEISLYEDILNSEKIKHPYVYIHYLPLGKERIKIAIAFFEKLGIRAIATSDPSPMLLEKLTEFNDMHWKCTGLDFLRIGKSRTAVLMLCR